MSHITPALLSDGRMSNINEKLELSVIQPTIDNQPTSMAANNTEGITQDQETEYEDH